MTSCGLSGNSGNLSMTTFRGGGGNNSPGTVIIFSHGGCGTCGGTKQNLNFIKISNI